MKDKQPVKLSFDQDGAPYSQAFDDIYFDTHEGCQQSMEVFLHTNQIFERLLQQESLSIGETGFGTGLNLLLTLQVIEQANNKLKAGTKLPTINYLSVEKYPLTKRTNKAIFSYLASFS